MSVKQHKTETIAALGAFVKAFYLALSRGFNEYQELVSGQPPIIRPTTRANLVYDLSMKHLKTLLHPFKDQVRYREKKGLVMILIKDKYLVKLKKLDKKYKSSNIPTKQSALFVNQGVLFEEDEFRVTNMEVGYRLDELQTDVQGIYFVCPKNSKSNHWVANLGIILQSQLEKATLFSQEDSEPKVKRFTVKKSA